MSKYRLKSDLDVAFIPGVGKVVKGKQYLGEAYSKHVGTLLVEVPDVPEKKPLESTETPSGPKPLTEPAPFQQPYKPSESFDLPKPTKILIEGSWGTGSAGGGSVDSGNSGSGSIEMLLEALSPMPESEITPPMKKKPKAAKAKVEVIAVETDDEGDKNSG